MLAGLPEGEERKLWELRITQRARKLRLYESRIPRWHKVMPWFFVVGLLVMLMAPIIDPSNLDTLAEDGPAMWGFMSIAVIGWALYITTGVLGRSLDGFTPDRIDARRAKR